MTEIETAIAVERARCVAVARAMADRISARIEVDPVLDALGMDGDSAESRPIDWVMAGARRAAEHIESGISPADLLAAPFPPPWAHKADV